MLETGMLGTGINHRGKTYLLDMPQTLHQPMVDYVHQQTAWNLNESKYRIIDNLALAHAFCL